MKTFTRRAVVVLGVCASLALGAVSIRAAADWTAASAPLDVAPVAAASVADQLAREEARSAELQAQLAELVARTSDLSTALNTAQDRISTDAASAARLRDRLSAAQKKLDALQRSLRVATSAPATTVVTRSSPPVTSGGFEGAEAEGHDD